MAQLPVPGDVGPLRSYLGLLNYYRCCIPRFAEIAQPMYKLLKKGADYLWTPDCQVAFDTLKQELCTEGKVLHRADPSRPYVLHTDWSKTGISAILNQIDEDGNEYLVACLSRSLNPHEQCYEA